MQTLDDHLNELRKRLKVVAIFLLVSTGVTFYFSSKVVKWIQSDLGFELHALSAYEALYTELMIAFLGGFLFSLPIILYELIGFMRPGLKEGEYRVMRNYLPFSVILFVVGAVFSYQYIVKSSLNFFQSTVATADVAAVWSLQNTVGFSLRLSAFTGIIFQLPIVSVILGRAGIIDTEMMVKYRAYFFIAILLVSAIATPPDIISQALVTLPVVGLYQISIFLVGKVQPEETDQENNEENIEEK